MRNKKFWQFILAVGVSELVGILGGIFTASSVDTWYQTLTKPSFNPPAWVFGPVWTTLYFLMGVALYLVWQKESDLKKRATTIFGVQLVLNFLWSLVFFGMQNPGLALINVVLLWFAIVATIFYFAKIDKLAAWLLVPYLLWVSFASVLNFFLWKLN